MTRYEMPPNHEPTPEQIKQLCAEIQESWSEAERRKRAGRNETAEWSPDTFKSPEQR